MSQAADAIIEHQGAAEQTEVQAKVLSRCSYTVYSCTIAGVTYDVAALASPFYHLIGNGLFPLDAKLETAGT